MQAAAFAPLASALPGAKAQAEPPIAAALRARVPHEGMGLAAAVAGPSGLQLALAGRRSASDATPPDADARFEYGSISKPFTALLLAERVQAQAFALDDPVEAVLGMRLRDAAGAPITWADLATHRAGLPRRPANLKPPGSRASRHWRSTSRASPARRRPSCCTRVCRSCDSFVSEGPGRAR